MRRTQPYTAVTDERPDAETPVVGTAPTRLSSRKYGTSAFEGINIFATHGYVSPMQSPWAGQGLISPAFPLYQSSKVAPDSIRIPVLLTTNLLQPVSHAQTRYNFSLTEPAKAQPPPTKLPTGNTFNRRGGGHQTTIQPMAVESWPTPAQWVQARMNQGFTGGQ